VERLTGIPNAVANLDPALPAKATAMDARASRNPALRVPLGQTRNLLGERAGPAVIPIAEEPTRRQPQHRRLTGDRQIRQVTAIAAAPALTPARIGRIAHPERADAPRS